MTSEQHQKRHKELHEALDELFAGYITNHPDQINFTSMPIMNLIQWSARMAKNPDHDATK